MVDKWLTPEWEEMHNACRERRYKMPGVAHHQGSQKLDQFAQRWSTSHGGQPCSQFKAWAMAHKGKAKSDVDYNPQDPPSAYSNETVHSRLSQYTEMAKSVHGPEYDPSTQDFDGEVVMRMGGGKKHGRYWLGDSVINSATTRTLSQIRATSTDRNPAIRPRPDTTQHRMDLLQAELQEERRLRQESELRMSAEREAERQRMEEMILYVQSLGALVGRPPPPGLLLPPPQPHFTPNQSGAASNDGPLQASPGSNIGPSNP